MGMFDTIFCQYPLPDTALQGHAFQTKSLDSLLEYYTITLAGRLVYHAGLRELPEDEDVPLSYDVEVADFWDEDTGFHGKLEFHDSIEGSWYEYLAHFTYGQVSEIKRVTKGDAPRPKNAVQTTIQAKRHADIFKEAVRIFGDVDSARAWLWVPNSALDGQTPLELAGREEGAARIQALLSKVSRTES